MHTVLTLANGKISEGSLSSLRTSNPVWVDIVSPTAEELQTLEQYTKIPADQIRAWMSGKKRPMALDFQKYSVITFLTPTHAIKSHKNALSTEPCVMLISNDRNDFITIHKDSLTAVEEIKTYTEKHLTEMLRQGATFVLFTLLDEIIEDYYDSLDQINEIVRTAEELALNVHPEAKLMQKILEAKKAMIFFHKALMANREIIMMIEQEHLSFLDEQMLRQFRVLSSSITQLIEINSTYRDILNTATEIHLTAINNSLNITMKKITSWGAIILVPSLIASVFGMNFKHFPAFDWPYGLHASLIAMGLSVVVLYWFFRKKDWL